MQSCGSEVFMRRVNRMSITWGIECSFLFRNLMIYRDKTIEYLSFVFVYTYVHYLFLNTYTPFFNTDIWMCQNYHLDLVYSYSLWSHWFTPIAHEKESLEIYIQYMIVDIYVHQKFALEICLYCQFYYFKGVIRFH